MVENLDFHVGRLIDHLKKIGEYENTIFVVFGDNGAEGTDLFKMIAGTPGTRDYLFAAINWSQTHPNAWGDPGSYVGYGPMWAQVSMTPFSQYKGWLAEGGIRNALIVSGPARRAAQGEHQPGAHARGRPHADAARDRGARAIRQTLDGRELPAAHGQVLGPDAGGQGGVATDGTGLSRVGTLRQPGAAPGRLEAALAVQAATARQTGNSSTLRPIPPSARISPPSNPDKVRALLALWDGYVRRPTTWCCPVAPRSRRWKTSCRHARRTTPATRRSSTSDSSCRPRTLLADPKP